MKKNGFRLVSNPRTYTKSAISNFKPLKKPTISDKIEVVSKLVPLFLTAASLLFGFYQFQRQQAIAETQEFKRKVWDKQLEAYNLLSNVTSQIMAKDGKIDSLSIKYKQVYWSTIPFFNESVEKYMNDFGEEINSVIRGEGKPGVLRTRGYFLLKECRKSLDSTYINVVR